MNSGLAKLYAEGWVYCTRCELYYPPIFGKLIRCQECSNLFRRKPKINRYNKSRNDGLGY